jgi:hypothetical protein
VSGMVGLKGGQGLWGRPHLKATKTVPQATSRIRASGVRAVRAWVSQATAGWSHPEDIDLS